jgi:hypothetical protein
MNIYHVLFATINISYRFFLKDDVWNLESVEEHVMILASSCHFVGDPTYIGSTRAGVHFD